MPPVWGFFIFRKERDSVLIAAGWYSLDPASFLLPLSPLKNWLRLLRFASHVFFGSPPPHFSQVAPTQRMRAGVRPLEGPFRSQKNSKGLCDWPSGVYVRSMFVKVVNQRRWLQQCSKKLASKRCEQGLLLPSSLSGTGGRQIFFSIPPPGRFCPSLYG